MTESSKNALKIKLNMVAPESSLFSDCDNIDIWDDHCYAYYHCRMSASIADPNDPRFTLIYDDQHAPVIYYDEYSQIMDIELDRRMTIRLTNTHERVGDDHLWSVHVMNDG